MAFEFIEFEALARDQQATFSDFVVKAMPLVTHWGQLLEAKIKANASTGYHDPGAPHIPGTGPGPNVATADYLRSIGPSQVVVTAFEVAAIVGSDAVQAARLEYGYVGPSTGGRHTQGLAASRSRGDPLGLLGAVVHGGSGHPYPHFGPALDWIAPQFEAAVATLAAAA